MIETAALGFALSAGMSRPAALARAGAATIAMSAGFLTVFGIFGLVVSPLIASVQK